ncbi:MAG TPA: glycosyltransferase family 39 protein, partial [Thermoanaerobaculia bacterium]|nr:glycosyltransferase family 39 protein [Thermoanaerobaculia bacterium]
MRRGTALLVLLGALAASSIPFLFAITAWPEVVTPSYLIARGLRLYDDIKFPHTPLLTLSTALFGRVLGFSASFLRADVAIVLAATAALVVAGVRPSRRRSARAALVGFLLGVPLLVFLVSYTEGPALWYEHAIAPVLLAATLALEAFERRGRARFLVASGLLLGTAVLVKQTSAWAALAAIVWLAVRSRRRSSRGAILLSASIAAPFLAFALLWAALFRTVAHLFWTFIVPVFHPHAREIGVLPDAAALHESLVLLFPVAAFFLLRRALPSARLFRSPAPWITLGGFGTAWPRFGLL